MGRKRIVAALAAASLTLAGGLVTATGAWADAQECAPSWQASTVYTAGELASVDGVTYRANWWTLGEDPESRSGASGTGQPWTATGACDAEPDDPDPTPEPTATATPTATPTPEPTDEDTACGEAWSASIVYTAGDVATVDGVSYRANWWTRGDDPAVRNGAAGTGEPWTALTSCASPPPEPTPEPTGTPTPTPEPTSTPTPEPTSTPTPEPTPSGDAFFSPYKDVTINLDWNTNTMRSAVSGTPVGLLEAGGVFDEVEGLDAITLAFATGECGSENWGGVDAQSFADANIDALDAAGVSYVVSTGGANGAFDCDSADGMRAFLDRYDSDHLIGVDFDIEVGQSLTDVENLIEAATAVQDDYPQLRFSFTIASLGASDGSLGVVNATGDGVVRLVQSSELANWTINLMTMNFGAASTAVCVVVAGECDMAASTIQAVENLEAAYGVPPERIEVTPMIGMNNQTDEFFTLDDVDEVVSYARENGLAGVHHWSLDRDTPCEVETAWATAVCHSVSEDALAFTARFASAAQG